MDDPSLKLKIIAAFAAVYFIWGSTYLGIRFAVESIPPFLMAGLRFTIAGLMLFFWARLRGAKMPQAKQWMHACIIGTLLLVMGNGAVVLAEQIVPSGVVSLLIAMVPVYFALLEWLKPGGKPPGIRVSLGLLTGIVGLIMLIGPDNIIGKTSSINMQGVLYVIIGSLCWSIGSLYSRSQKLSDSPAMGLSMQTLAAGIIMLLISFCVNEPQHFVLSSVSLKSALALGYLLVFGSLIGFSAYVWLLQTVRPTLVATYAYVNPVVAVFLGWAFAGESLNSSMIIAATVILCAVWIITQSAARPAPLAAKRTQALATNET
jgi:drug/metabolite transporter (DMT)-like permease